MKRTVQLKAKLLKGQLELVCAQDSQLPKPLECPERYEQWGTPFVILFDPLSLAPGTSLASSRGNRCLMIHNHPLSTTTELLFPFPTKDAEGCHCLAGGRDTEGRVWQGSTRELWSLEVP